jgi:hypothetical protein
MTLTTLVNIIYRLCWRAIYLWFIESRFVQSIVISVNNQEDFMVQGTPTMRLAKITTKSFFSS